VLLRVSVLCVPETTLSQIHCESPRLVYVLGKMSVWIEGGAVPASAAWEQSNRLGERVCDLL
jgi:hypothetical protein